MTRSSDERLDDIRAAIDRCLSYREYLDSAELGTMAYDAVLRNLAVIGEAVKAVPADLKEAHGDVEWAAIAGLRNVVVHEYFRVNPDLIRNIVEQHLVVLRAALNTAEGA